MAIISNSVTIADAGAFSVDLGAMTHIKTLTASSSANLTFVDGASSVVIDDTYPMYILDLINIHPQTNDVFFKMGFNAAGASGFDETITSSYFKTKHTEDDSEASLAYDENRDLAQSTNFPILSQPVGNSNDDCLNGRITLFNPSSTTFVTHFMSRVTHNYPPASPFETDAFTAGYINTTAAIDEIFFKFDSGNIDSGKIKLYGIKDS